jgi:Protein of unknown function (DUF1592)/Protein of unknown function (DUF1588)/Protein of unknown function (DUF1595)/Protein of unknown function (DUF1585)/Protein of unknown function (DUF1587)
MLQPKATTILTAAVLALGSLVFSCGTLGAVAGSPIEATPAASQTAATFTAQSPVTPSSTPSEDGGSTSHGDSSAPSVASEAPSATQPDAGGEPTSDAGAAPPKIAAECAVAPPGHVGLQRLSLPQLENTLEDLLGFAVTAPSLYPRDDRTGGYITVPEAQLVSQGLMEQHLNWSVALAHLTVTSAAPLVMWCDTETAGCSEQIVERFMRRAFRRPPRDEEVEHFTSMLAQGDGNLNERLETALAAILNAPQFLFRERTTQNPAHAVPLSNHDLATRLSYFIWNSMPDESLSEAADDGTLADPGVLDSHVRRLLASPRSNELARTMADQWLDLSRLWDHSLSREAFPEYGAALKESMYQQTVRFLARLLQEGRPVAELVTATDSFVDARLAEVYGLPGTFDEEFVLTDVALAGQRPGLLAHASVLSLTSSGDETSIIRRGKWVTTALLCLGVSSPPATLDTSLNEELPSDATPREVVAIHGTHPQCVACHQQLDPPGLVLEGYDPLGRIRTNYPPPIDRPIDTSAVFLDGTAVADVAALSRFLAADAQLSRCVADRIFPLAVGRLLGKTENELLQQLGAEEQPEQFTFAQFVSRLVQSSAFRCDAGEPSP